MQAAPRPVVVAFGDSITRGVHVADGDSYPDVLGRLPPQVEVVNRDFPGSTVAQARARLEEDVLALRAAGVVLLFGVNDSVMTAPDHPEVPPVRFEKLLREMMTLLRKAGAKPVVATLPPVMAEVYYTRHPTSYSRAVGGMTAFLACYDGLVRRVAETRGVPLVDLDVLFRGKENPWIRTAPEGVHPNAAGHRAIAAVGAEAGRRQLALRDAATRSR